MSAPIRIETASTYFGGDAIKALGDGKVGGYLVVFGGPADSQGEWFDPSCEFHLDWFGGTTRPVLYHHGLKDQDVIEEIGSIYKLVVDNRGLWAEGQLDMENPRAQQVYSDINKNRIGWSSGSAPHLSKIDEGGRITEWAIVEASLTPTPAAGKRTTVQALKFDTSTFTPDDNAPIEPDPVKEATVTKGKRRFKHGRNRGKGIMQVKFDTALVAALENAGIAADQILSILKEMGDSDADNMPVMADDAMPADDMPMEPAKDAGPVTYSASDGSDISDSGPTPAMTPPSETYPTSPNSAGKALAKTAGTDGNAMAQVVRLMMANMKTAPAASKAQSAQYQNPARQSPRITDMKTQFHKLSAADMAFLYEMRRQGKNPRLMGIEFEREMATKAMKEYQSDKLDLSPETARKVAVKADFNNTIVSTEGANWVPDLWSSILWQRVRVENNVARNVEVFQMPSPTFEYPIESTDPVVYSVGESDTDAEQTLATNPFTRSKIAVNKLQFVSKKTGLQVGFSTEIEEDSIIPFIPQLRNQATRAFANSIDYNLLNSDSTTGTGNINYKSGNTSSVSTANFLFGGGNGMRYNALVSNTNAGLSFAGGIPTLSQIRSLRFKMLSTTNAYAINPEDLVIVVDLYTYGKMLSIDEINVYMNNGRNATVNTGLVPNIDGIEVYASAELGLADSTGYITNANYPNLGTPSATNLGQMVMFAKNAWKVGYVRQVMTDVSFVPWNDSYILTMTARYAIGKKDTVASTLGYNINVQ